MMCIYVHNNNSVMVVAIWLCSVLLVKQECWQAGLIIDSYEARNLCFKKTVQKYQAEHSPILFPFHRYDKIL